MTRLAAERAVEFSEVRRRTDHSAKAIGRYTRGECAAAVLPELSQRVHVGENAIESVRIRHFRAPRVCIVDEKHLRWRVLGQAWKSFVRIGIRLREFLVGLQYFMSIVQRTLDRSCLRRKLRAVPRYQRCLRLEFGCRWTRATAVLRSGQMKVEDLSR